MSLRLAQMAATSGLFDDAIRSVKDLGDAQLGAAYLVMAAARRPLMLQLAIAHAPMIEPRNEVMSGGRVVDLDLATVRKSGVAARLVDDARVVAALESEG